MVVDTKGSFIITKSMEKVLSKQKLINGEENGSKDIFKEKGSK
jgi:hypothetical protein